jgi:DNA polymerase-3 subunit beta
MAESERQLFRIRTSKEELTQRLSQVPTEEIDLVFDPNAYQFQIVPVEQEEVAQPKEEPTKEEPVEQEEKQEWQPVILPASTFLQTVREVAFAASTDDDSGQIWIWRRGVIFRFEGHELKLVAADGCRLSFSKISTDVENQGQIFVDAKQLKKACRTFFPRGRRTKNRKVQILVKPEGLEVKLVDTNAEVVVEYLSATPRIPSFEQLIPKPQEGVVFERRELLAKLELLTQEDMMGCVRIESLRGNGVDKLRLWKRYKDPGQKEQMREEFLTVGGRLPSRVALNREWLIQLLRSVNSRALRLETTSETNPVAFRKYGDKNFLHLIMPIWIQWDIPDQARKTA